MNTFYDRAAHFVDMVYLIMPQINFTGHSFAGHTVHSTITHPHPALAFAFLSCFLYLYFSIRFSNTVIL